MTHSKTIAAAEDFFFHALKREQSMIGWTKWIAVVQIRTVFRGTFSPAALNSVSHDGSLVEVVVPSGMDPTAAPKGSSGLFGYGKDCFLLLP
jgi:hypothetical protein